MNITRIDDKLFSQLKSGKKLMKMLNTVGVPSYFFSLINNEVINK